MKTKMTWALAALICVPAMGVAQTEMTARQAREESLMASRYEQMIGKLQQQNDALRGDIRTLQRAQDQLQRQMEETQSKMQSVADDAQKLGAVDVRNLGAGQRQLSEKLEALNTRANALSWGDGQRDCPELNAKHQQVRVMMKPDGTRSVSFLCFDGKALHMGSALYVAQDESLSGPSKAGQ